MRIVYFDFTNNFGGAPQGAIHLAERLSARHEVHIIDAYGRCKEYYQAIRAANLCYHVLLPEARFTYIGGKGLSRFLSLAKQIAELNHLRQKLTASILNINPDIIWVMNEKSLTMVALNPSLWHYPTAVYIQGWATPDQVGLRFRLIMKNRTNAVIAVSTATEKQLLKAGIPKDKLFLGSMTIDISKIMEMSQEQIVSPLPGHDLSPKILILSARPERAKGHLTALKAVAKLKQAGYKPALWMTGKIAVGHKDDFIDELRRLSEQLNIIENIFFLGWQNNIPAVIQAADICILPSHTEGLPRSILEAMLLRKPVIATLVGGVGDVVIDKKTGFLMPIDGDESLAAIIQNVFENKYLRNQITSAAYDHVMNHFHPELHTIGIEKIFAKLTAR